MTTQKLHKYQVYLLRCWQESDETPASAVWRFSMENPRTGQRRGFASLEALALALQSELAASDPEKNRRSGPGEANLRR